MRVVGLMAAISLLGIGCGDDAHPSDLPDVPILIGEGIIILEPPSRDVDSRDIDNVDTEDLSVEQDLDGGLDVLDPLDVDAQPDAEETDSTDSGPAADAEVGTDVDVIDDCRRAPLTTLTATEATDRASLLDGTIVRITPSNVRIGTSSCEDSCADAGVCCSECRAPLMLGDIILRGSLCTEGSTVACIGSSCGPLVCAPPLIPAPLAIEGRLRATNPVSIELFRVLR